MAWSKGWQDLLNSAPSFKWIALIVVAKFAAAVGAIYAMCGIYWLADKVAGQ